MSTLPIGAVWLPYPSSDHALYDVLVVGRIQRFQDDGPCYAEALGQRLGGAFSLDSVARGRVERAIAPHVHATGKTVPEFGGVWPKPRVRVQARGVRRDG